MLTDITRRLYGMPVLEPVLIRPVVALGGDRRVFVYFQDKLGGEIGLSRTAASPELSFDITVVELLPAARLADSAGNQGPAVRVGRYGVFELQTMDFHGT